MKKVMLLTLFLGCWQILLAQCPTDITFNRQSQIDSFPILFPQCTDITGRVVISGADISDLAGLSSIKSISTLEIKFNKKLTDLSGLDQLDSIYTGFNLDVNDSLLSLHGLENLHYIGGSFYMNNNHDLADLLGLQNLRVVKGRFSIIGTSLITDLKGLDSLYEAGELFVSNNYSLVDYKGIEQLRKVGNLWLLGNYASNVDAFSRLDTIDQLLQIENNPFLTNIWGFENLKAVKAGRVWIRGNSRLSQCTVFAVCRAIARTPANVFISGNQSGCSSKDEIAGSCLARFNISGASGKIYADLDCNGNFDSSDVFIPNHILRNQHYGFPWASSGPNGAYTSLLDNSTTTYIVPDSIPGFFPVPAADTFEVTTGVDIYENRDFGFCPDSSFHNLSVSVYPFTFVVRGFHTQFQVCVRNKGSNTENATLTFDLIDTSGLNNNELVYGEGGTRTNTGFHWDIRDLRPFESRCFRVRIYTPPTSVLGAEFDVKVAVGITPSLIESDTSDNCQILSQIIVGSYDPNDKTVMPENLYYPESQDGPWLDYLIRFQNTGTFPATFVEVYDTLEAGLDASSIQMLEASHPYSLSFPKADILKWRFDNIQLPDSTSDEPNSHGFIAFRIRTQPGLPADKILRNRAGIYFDFNEVVLTEYAETGFYLVGTREQTRNLDFRLYPNPVGEASTLFMVLENDYLGKMSLEIVDFSGRIRQRKEVLKTAEKQRFTLDNLPPGQAFWVRIANRDACANRLVLRF